MALARMWPQHCLSCMHWELCCLWLLKFIIILFQYWKIFEFTDSANEQQMANAYNHKTYSPIVYCYATYVPCSWPMITLILSLSLSTPLNLLYIHSSSNDVEHHSHPFECGFPGAASQFDLWGSRRTHPQCDMDHAHWTEDGVFDLHWQCDSWWCRRL